VRHPTGAGCPAAGWTLTSQVFCVAAQWKDGIANSHKNYRGNVELFGGGCFSSGQHDKGSSNFTDNHCFVGKESALLLFQFPNGLAQGPGSTAPGKLRQLRECLLAFLSLGGRPSFFNCACNITCTGWPEICTPCPRMARNHYYQDNLTYVACGLTLPQIQSQLGVEIGSTVAHVPSAGAIVQIAKTQLGMPPL
jgi:hypothetical protein